MYSRNIKETPKSIVHNGKINFGTYKKVTDKLEIRGLKLPFIGIPTPKIISNMRIKSRIAYMFNIGSYIGMVEFLDSKIFGLAEVIFWNKETGQSCAGVQRNRRAVRRMAFRWDRRIRFVCLGFRDVGRDRCAHLPHRHRAFCADRLDRGLAHQRKPRSFGGGRRGICRTERKRIRILRTASVPFMDESMRVSRSRCRHISAPISPTQASSRRGAAVADRLRRSLVLPPRGAGSVQILRFSFLGGRERPSSRPASFRGRHHGNRLPLRRPPHDGCGRRCVGRIASPPCPGRRFGL